MFRPFAISALWRLRWPPFVAAWIAVAAGHVAARGLHLPHDAEPWLRVASVGLGVAALATGKLAAAASRVARSAAFGLGVLALAAAGGALGFEASRRGAPLEVHPRALPATIYGFVADASGADQTPAALRVDVAGVEVGSRRASARATVRFLWPDGAAPPTWAVAGTPIAARGLVRPLEDARNPGGSPPGRWLEQGGIDATFEAAPGSVEPWTPPPGAAGRDRRSGSRLAAEIRRSLGRFFDAHAPAGAAALARGMLLGDRVGIDAATRDSFRNAGTLHILSISGLHVCIVAGFVAIAARALRLGAAVGTAFELAALAAYVLFVGAPPPALRSALLWTLARGARLVGRGNGPFAAWGAAGLVLHLADPSLPHDLGFLLSFGAVLGLDAGASLVPEGHGSPDREARWRRWARGAMKGAAAGIGASVGTLPAEAAAFGSVPIAGPLANLVVIPITTLFLAEAILLSAVGPLVPAPIADLLGGALGAAADLLRFANDHLGGRVAPFPVHGAPALGALAAAYLVLLVAAGRREANRGGPERSRAASSVVAALLVGAAAAIPILSALDPLALSRPRPPRIVFLDVGQGDAALVIGARGETVAMDAGPRSERRDEGRVTVEPALRAEGVRGRVSVVASHGHRDHEGGIGWLATRDWIEHVFENSGGGADRETWRRDVRRHEGRVDAARPRTTRGLVAGAWRVAIEGPRAGRDPALPAAGTSGAPATSANTAENDRSLVASVLPAPRDRSDTPRTALFPGDIERGGEDAWLDAGIRIGRALVLKVPHHGSRTSSTDEWVARVRPVVAVVSAGERNRHRHPSPETLRRYRRAGAWVVRTDREGAIRVTAAASGLLLSTRAHPSPRPVTEGEADSLSRYIDFP